jgi:hypothetical protein
VEELSPTIFLTGERAFTYTNVIMSKQQLISFLKRELAVVNEQIDYKILQGQSYRAESMKHRTLARQITKVYAR